MHFLIVSSYQRIVKAKECLHCTYIVIKCILCISGKLLNLKLLTYEQVWFRDHDFHNFGRDIPAWQNHLLRFSAECSIVEKKNLICIKLLPNMFGAWGVRVMKFKTYAHLFLWMLYVHTKFVQVTLTSFKQEDENVQISTQIENGKQVTWATQDSSDLKMKLTCTYKSSNKSTNRD